ncbi:MAG: DMT family transporter [Bosea sp. (in: a-proteobacteria)]
MPDPQTATTAPRMSGLAWAMLIALSVLWGGSFLFAKVAVSELPPFTVVWLRVMLAALALHLVLRLVGLSMNVGWERWRQFFTMGFLNNMVPFSLIFWGQTQIGAGLASILNATTPLFTVLVAHVLTRDERASGLRLAGVIAGFAGVAMMMGPDALAGASANLWAQIACLGAAVSYAFAGVYGRRFKGLPPLVTATGQVSASTLMMLPVVLIHDRIWALPMPSAPVVVSVIALALASTALAYILFFNILKRAGATNLSLVTLLIPVSAIMLGWSILGEALLPRHFLGMAGIALGLALIDGRLFRRG